MVKFGREVGVLEGLGVEIFLGMFHVERLATGAEVRRGRRVKDEKRQRPD